MKRAISLPVFAAAAIGLGVIGFGAGFGVRAMADESDSSTPTVERSSDGDIATNMGGGFAPKSVPTGIDSGEAGRSLGYGTNDTMLAGGCQGDLTAPITANGIDLAAAGMTLRPLGSAFVPMSFSVRSEGDCDVSIRDSIMPPGSSENATLVVDTTWRHKDSGVHVTVSQRISDEPLSNTIRQNFAQFTTGGYDFTVYANIYYYTTKGVDSPSTNPSSGPGSAPANSSMIAPEGEVNLDVLLAAIKDIAPELGEQCFATETTGEWSDLAALGIGDPRGAVPTDIPLQQMYLTYLQPAAESCGGAPLPAGKAASFNANWYAEKNQSSVSVNASAIDPRYPQGTFPGNINEYYANWQSDGMQFNVYGYKSNGGLGIDTIRKIAKALDPSFDDKCFVQETKFDAGKLSSFGLSTPETPDGYKKGEESSSATSIASGCTKPEGYTDSFNYNVQFTDGDDVIAVNIGYYGAVEPAVGAGYITEGNINWTTSDGVNISVGGYNQGTKSGGPSLDDLKEVAKSIDPDVDFDAMSDRGNVVPLPAPAVDGGR